MKKISTSLAVIVFLLAFQTFLGLPGRALAASSPLILLNAYTDPATPTVIYGDVTPAGSVSNLNVLFENMSTGEVWDGTIWNSAAYASFPLQPNPAGSFSYNLSGMSFVSGDQYLITVYGFDSSNNYISNEEFFTYGPTATISVDDVTNFNQVTGTAPATPTVWVLDTATTNCWDGTAWSPFLSPACDLTPTYDSATQKWSLDVSGVQFTQDSQYEIYANDVSNGIYAYRYFYDGRSSAPSPVCVTGADTNANGVIDISELLSYIGNWKIGNVSISLLLSAIGFWKVGVGC